MRRPATNLYICSAALGLCLLAACAPRSEPDLFPESDRITGDSARAVAAALAKEQTVSSASAAGVTFTDAERNRFTRVEQMIQAKFAGVQVSQGSGGYAIRIRGTGSMALSNDPLVLIDGVTRSVADLGKISPKDVDTIAVVKDAAAAYYGVRGANGVILIKTRRGP